MEISNSDKIKYYKDKITHLSAGGFVFFESEHDKKLYVALLVKKDGSVMIPKGHIKRHEDVKDAALREVKEELILKENPEIITDLGTDKYTFYLNGDIRKHYKKVYLYVFSVRNKVNISPLEKEDFIEAKWFDFNEALTKITFDRNNLLKARQAYYFHKSVKVYNNLLPIF